MEETLRNHLLELARRLETAAKVTPATVGKRALNDNTIFARLTDSGAGFTVRTYDRLVAWFAANWPEAAEWPADIERPGASVEQERLAS